MNAEDAIRACLDGKKVHAEGDRSAYWRHWDGQSFRYVDEEYGNQGRVEIWRGEDYELYEPEPALNPCPKCQGTDIRCRNVGCPPTYWCKCMQCLLLSPTCASRPAGREAWNAMEPEPAVPEPRCLCGHAHKYHPLKYLPCGYPGCGCTKFHTNEPEPQRVRWKLEWASSRPVYKALILQPPNSPERWDVVQVPASEIDGYRFNAWVYKLPDGRELLLDASGMPIYWNSSRRDWTRDPGEGHTPIHPEHVEMVKVAR